MGHRFHPLLGSAVALVLLIGFAGCGAAKSTTTSSRYPITTVSDTPASNLEVVVQVDGDYSDSLNLAVLFFISRGKPMDTEVKFTGGQTVTCGGIKLAQSGGDSPEFPGQFTGSIAKVPASHKVTCVYTAQGLQLPFSFLVPPKLVILTPHGCTPTACTKQHGAIAVTYQPAGAQYGTTTVMAELSDPQSRYIFFGYGPSVYSPAQPDTGTCHLDISTMPSSREDFLWLYREFTLTPAQTTFQSLTIDIVQSYNVELGIN